MVQNNKNVKMDRIKEDSNGNGVPAVRKEGSERRSSTVTSLPGRCDICGMKDGFKDNNLQQCKTCGIYVHETCYGFVGEKGGTKLPDWECKACEAVGNTFLGITYESKKPISILQSKRPRECVLCSVHTGNHAMHMVYDKVGKEGVPLVLPAKRKDGKNHALPQRIAWVHSLCSFFICSNPPTQGCIFGCTKSGYYEGAEESEQNSFPSISDSDSSSSSSDFYDNQSVSSSSDDEQQQSKQSKSSLPSKKNNKNHLTKVKPKKESSTHSTANNSNQNEDDQDDDDDDDDDEDSVDDMHHFVFADEDPWIEIINAHRKLKCYICGENDQKKNVLRIPVQCHAGDKHEFEEFKGSHPNSSGHETCCKAMHVGCSRWGLTKSGEKFVNQHVYFYPGRRADYETSEEDNIYNEPVVGIYCLPHAKDIKNRKKKVKEIEDEVISSARRRPKVEDYQELPPDWDEKNLTGSLKDEKNEVSTEASSTTKDVSQSNFSQTINQMKNNGKTKTSETSNRDISNSAEKINQHQ